MKRKSMAYPTALLLALSCLSACSQRSSSPDDDLTWSIVDETANDRQTSTTDSSPEMTSAPAVTKNTVDGSDTGEYIYAGLSFEFPADAAETPPRFTQASNSWMYILGAGKYNAIVSVAWFGDPPSITSSEAAQSHIERIQRDGFTPTVTDTEVAGASEAVLITWTEDNEEVVTSIWENAQTSRMVCRSLYVTGTNDGVYNAQACSLEGDAEADALAKSFIESVEIDED